MNNRLDVPENLISIADSTGIEGKTLKEIRYPICQSCEHFKKKIKFCDVCSCFMPIKTLFKKCTCPIGKW